MAIQINGNGTITGISNGGLPDGCILDADINGMAASKLTGTLPDARFPSTLPAVSGANLTGISTSSPTETYGYVNFSSTYDANSGYVVHGIGSGGGNNMTINSTNERVTPTVAGNYFVLYMCIWLWSWTGSATWYNRITKNGSEQQRSQFSAYNPGSYNNTTASIISMNGSSDYFQFEGYENKSNQTAYMGNLSRAYMFLLKES